MLSRSFLTEVTGAEPISAQSAARFWGAPGNTKAMLSTPQDRGQAASLSAVAGGELPSFQPV